MTSSDREVGAKATSNPPDPGALARAISENFPSVYLTMLSIVQGVVLTDLATIVFSDGSHFTVLNWIQVATMLWTLIFVWNHFMADALMTRWIPDLEDAVLLFGTGVFELVANHSIQWSAGAWVGTLSAMLFAWALGNVYIRRQEQLVLRDDGLMQLLHDRMRPLLIETLAGGVVLLVLAILCALMHATWQSGSGASRGIAVVTVGLGFAASVLVDGTSATFWRRVRKYVYSARSLR